MASERLQQAILLLPLLLIACDVWTAVRPLPAKHHHHSDRQAPQEQVVQPPYVPGAKDAASYGGKFHISFCTSCSFKNQAMQTKTMLETLVPGTVVVLSNYPPPFHKRMLSKIVPAIQFGGIGVALAGEQIFPMLGYAAPPAWYNTFRQNKFGAVASCWLIGNFLQNALLGTGAFEVYYDGDLVFSKLQTKRFPTDDELRDSIGKLLVRKTGTVY
ncbi:selT-like protein [Selaginella moellendorffii]|nr:selT-like protein [Selaginella moellendorffii]|eukprot:XP_002963506.2 selT-like protein [Selaginella moellendorffii]